jgi:phospholipid/cholesterol/gamma-HCH transport system ATP-binding protein
MSDDRQDSEAPKIRVTNLKMAFGSFVLQRDLNFEVRRGEIFVFMGGSGCGKSVLMRHLLGLKAPAEGEIAYDGESFTGAAHSEQQEQLRKFGVLYQAGALWSSMTVGENIALPLEEYTELGPREIKELVDYKLSLVGLRGVADHTVSKLSGGMRKRAALARAMALDPEILFFDEPSAGLDPIASRQLDATILQLRDSLGATVVLITHELSSIYSIADRAIFLDAKERTITGEGAPRELLRDPPNESIKAFLTRNHTEYLDEA